MELLRSVDAAQAVRRPVTSAHSIWELTLHMTAWSDIARRRLEGAALESPAADIDWPPVPEIAGADEWMTTMQHLSDAYESLARAVKELPADELQARVSGNDYSVETMLSGVVEHGVYHAGQIAVLLKADRDNHSKHN